MLGPQLHMNNNGGGSQLMHQPIINDEVKKSRTPDKLKIKSKAKIIGKEQGLGDFQITQDFIN